MVHDKVHYIISFQKVVCRKSTGRAAQRNLTESDFWSQAAKARKKMKKPGLFFRKSKPIPKNGYAYRLMNSESILIDIFILTELLFVLGIKAKVTGFLT